jgi:hypothetical protein
MVKMNHKLNFGCYLAVAISLGISIFAMAKYFQLAKEFKDVNRRVSGLEQKIQYREKADPLMPVECAVDSGLGETQDRPCRTTFDRLLRAPQQFHGRWIAVSGMYGGGFEESALYSSTFEMSESSILNHHSAVWISPAVQSSKPALEKKVFAGKFHNGPSGHLSAYFGELIDAAALQE